MHHQFPCHLTRVDFPHPIPQLEPVWLLYNKLLRTMDYTVRRQGKHISKKNRVEANHGPR